MNTVKNSFLKNALWFLPLLVLYIVLIFAFSPDHLVDDEDRHLAYAENILNGFYADAENPSIRNGPGYPLVLSVALVFKAPILLLKLMNPVFLVLALVFFYQTLRFHLEHKQALIVSFILGLYPPILKFLLEILSESFVVFLVCGFLYYFLRIFHIDEKKHKDIVLSIFFLGFLLLTKIIFGYVVLSALIFLLVIHFIKKSKATKYGLIVLAGSFLFSIPYLMYTYSVTGKSFVWGTQGGEVLYWRTAPFENELGNWISMDAVLADDKSRAFVSKELIENHGKLMNSLVDLSFVKRDSVFKTKGIENMKNHPVKFAKNTVASFSRLFFNYPYSYAPQKITSYFYIIPNMFLVVCLLLAMFLAWVNRKTIPFEMRFLVLISAIFIGGLTLLDGRARHLLPAIPLLLFFIAFVFQKFITIKNRDQI